jgi:hypothetical protein
MPCNVRHEIGKRARRRPADRVVRWGRGADAYDPPALVLDERLRVAAKRRLRSGVAADASDCRAGPPHARPYLVATDRRAARFRMCRAGHPADGEPHGDSRDQQRARPCRHCAPPASQPPTPPGTTSIPRPGEFRPPHGGKRRKDEPSARAGGWGARGIGV